LNRQNRDVDPNALLFSFQRSTGLRFAPRPLALPSLRTPRQLVKGNSLWPGPSTGARGGNHNF
jgi:hypothetical protein